jgi:hypothetical protein
VTSDTTFSCKLSKRPSSNALTALSSDSKSVEFTSTNSVEVLNDAAEYRIVDGDDVGIELGKLEGDIVGYEDG